MDISGGIGLPLQIDKTTKERTCRYYAHILVDVDLSGPPPNLVMVEFPGDSMLVKVMYENLPPKCTICRIIGHDHTQCQ